jgi:hypothetical protein
MANEIALYFGRDQLVMIQGEYVGNTPRIERIIVEDWPVDPFDGDVNTLGSWLKEIKQKQQLTGISVSVVLPREQVIVRQLELPKVDENERFDMLRFQIATKLTIPVEQLVTDFYLLPSSPSSTGEITGDKVFVAAVRSALVDRVTKILSSAAWELKQLLPAYVPLAEFAARSKSEAQEPTLVVWKHGQTMEWVALQAGKVITTQQVKKYDATPEQQARAVAMDIKRAMVNFPELEKSAAIDLLSVNQESDSSFTRGLEEDFKLPVKVHEYDLTKFDFPAESLAFALPLLGSIGQLHNQLIEKLDLANPRKPKPKVDNTRAKRLAILGGGVLAVAAVYFSWNMLMEGYQSQISKYTREKNNLTDTLKIGTPILEADKALTSWQELDQDPLKQIIAINQLSPGSQAVYMASLKFLADEAKGVVHVTGDGLAKEREDVDVYYEQLVSAGFRIRPKAIEQLSGSRDYPYKFTLDADLPDTNVKPQVSKNKAGNKVNTSQPIKKTGGQS